jgi:hypothetical protein
MRMPRSTGPGVPRGSGPSLCPSSPERVEVVLGPVPRWEQHKKSRSGTRDCAFMRRNARYVAYKGYQLFETPLALRQRSLL